MNHITAIQTLKLKTLPFNDYYSYRNPNFIEEFFCVRPNESKIGAHLEHVYKITSDGLLPGSMDTIKRIVAIYWRAPSCKQTAEAFYFEQCARLAEQYFVIRKGHIYVDGVSRYEASRFQLSVGEDYYHKFQWYLLKHIMEPQLLVCTYMVDKDLKLQEWLGLLNSPLFTTETLLEEVLNKGMSEMHMHVGAAKRFDTIWTKLMNNKKEKNEAKREKVLESIKLDTYEGTIPLTTYIEAAQLLRLQMALFLNKGEETRFERYIGNQGVSSEIQQEVYKVVEKVCQGEKLESLDVHYKQIIDEIRRIHHLEYSHASSEIEDYGIPEAYLSTHLLSQDSLAKIFTDIYTVDEEKNILYMRNKDCKCIMPELIFLYKGLDYIKRTNYEDVYFTKCFWQYIKIKNMFYHYIVEQFTSGKGLDIFSTIYRKQSNIPLAIAFQEAFESQLACQKIKKFEFRLGCIASYESLKGRLIHIFKCYKSLLESDALNSLGTMQPPLIGIVFHFNKQEDLQIADKCLYEYEQNSQQKHMYFGELKQRYKAQAKNIAKLRREVPYIDNYIVGIDAASKELTISPVMFKEVYAIFRDLKYMSSTSSRPIRDIGFTYHVGEEFRDIVSGLRQVDEVIEQLDFKSGNRIGHGIVLGIDIEKWAQMNPVVHLQADEYLDNLLWEWGIYVQARMDGNHEDLLYLRTEINKAMEYIYGFSGYLQVEDLYKVYQYRLNQQIHCSVNGEECLLKKYTKRKYCAHAQGEQLQNTEIQSIMKELHDLSWSPEMLSNALNCSYFLKEMKKTVVIHINSRTIEKYKKLQAYMKRKISDRQIIVEVNPTSNIIIGQFQCFEDYHILNLSSPKEENVIVTINSDDPVIFNTSISNEYALIYDIVKKTGQYESKEIIKWLDQIRRNGLDYSFIEDRRLDKAEIIKELEVMIKELQR